MDTSKLTHDQIITCLHWAGLTLEQIEAVVYQFNLALSDSRWLLEGRKE